MVFRDRTYSLVGFRIGLKYRPLEALLVHYLPAFLLVIFKTNFYPSISFIRASRTQSKRRHKCQNLCR